MARARSPEKRRAILQAAVDEIAKAGLAAPTAKIARRAGVAAGTLFLYFSNKEELLNELYLELKGEAYKRINANFPHEGTLECRARHIWSSYLDWALQFPDKRKVSRQLNVSVRARSHFTYDLDPRFRDRCSQSELTPIGEAPGCWRLT